MHQGLKGIPTNAIIRDLHGEEMGAAPEIVTTEDEGWLCCYEGSNVYPPKNRMQTGPSMVKTYLLFIGYIILLSPA